jgi:hypothetical protein
MFFLRLLVEEKGYRAGRAPRNGDRMKTRVTRSCEGCRQRGGSLKVYRDPFGEAFAPGRWPTLAMHSDCFLVYLIERRSFGLSSASR